MRKPKCYGNYFSNNECQFCDYGESCYIKSFEPNCMGEYDPDKKKCSKCDEDEQEKCIKTWLDIY